MRHFLNLPIPEVLIRLQWSSFKSHSHRSRGREARHLTSFLSFGGLRVAAVLSLAQRSSIAYFHSAKSVRTTGSVCSCPARARASSQKTTSITFRTIDMKAIHYPAVSAVHSPAISRAVDDLRLCIFHLLSFGVVRR